MKKLMIVLMVVGLASGCASRTDPQKDIPASCDRARALEKWCDESSHGYFCMNDTDVSESTCIRKELSPEIGPWATYCCY